jgi:hypothetical protein
MTTNSLESIIFENRASKSAEYPRLHMKEPETFIFTESINFTPVEKEIHLAIGFRLGVGRWYLDIETNNSYKETKIFSSLQDIKEFIRKKFNKNPILPNNV